MAAKIHIAPGLVKICFVYRKNNNNNTNNNTSDNNTTNKNNNNNTNNNNSSRANAALVRNVICFYIFLLNYL